MSSHKLIISSLVIIGAIIFSFVPASAFTTQWLQDLSDLEAVKGEPFLFAEGRIGDSGGVAETYERALFFTNAGPIPPEQTGNFTWENAIEYDFSFSYVNSTNTATFDVDGMILTYQPSTDKSYNSIFIRSFASVSGSTMALTELSLSLGSNSPEDLPEVVATASDTDRILWVIGITQDFSLTGKANLSWGPPVPVNSQLAFQIKVTEAVPIPGAAWLLASGLAGLVFMRRKFRVR